MKSEYEGRYTAETHSATLDAGEFIARYRDYGRFSRCCEECPQYGKSWACPPFAHDIEGELARYGKILFEVVKITPERRDLPLSEARELLKPERMKLEKKFIELEKTTGGLFLGFAGSCPYCDDGECTRIAGRPCRHPELCHPSLEAYGFDLCKAAREACGVEILWSSDGRVPEYLTLVCGLFY